MLWGKVIWFLISTSWSKSFFHYLLFLVHKIYLFTLPLTLNFEIHFDLLITGSHHWDILHTLHHYFFIKQKISNDYISMLYRFYCICLQRACSVFIYCTISTNKACNRLKNCDKITIYLSHQLVTCMPFCFHAVPWPKKSYDVNLST